MATLYNNPFQLGLELYLRGITGATGIGLQGLIGPQGDIGIQGPIGLPGAFGPNGSTGPIGLQGTQGAQGDYGFQGLMGEVGAQGIGGVEGYQGVQGVQGTTGDIGIQGRDGIQGYQGQQGDTGYQGDIGLPGPIGPQGLVGGGITITSYTPSLVSGANLTAVAGTASGRYMTIGTTKFAWGTGTWRWAVNTTTGGGVGNTPSISFPSGFFSTVTQFLPAVTDVGGDLVQLVNGDLSGLNTVGNFVAYRPTFSGTGVNYFFVMSFWAIGT